MRECVRVCAAHKIHARSLTKWCHLTSCCRIPFLDHFILCPGTTPRGSGNGASRSAAADAATRHPLGARQGGRRSAVAVLAAGRRPRRLPELAGDGGGEQRQVLAHGAGAVRRVRLGLHGLGPVRPGRGHRRGRDRRLRRQPGPRRRGRDGRLGHGRRRHLPVQPALLPGQAVRAVRPGRVQGVGEQRGVPGDTGHGGAVPDAQGRRVQGLPAHRERRGGSGRVHGRQPRRRRVRWLRPAHHEERGVPWAELGGVQVGGAAAAGGGRRVPDPRQRRRPVERPAGRLRRRARLQSAQPHVLRPLIGESIP